MSSEGEGQIPMSTPVPKSRPRGSRKLAIPEDGGSVSKDPPITSMKRYDPIWSRTESISSSCQTDVNPVPEAPSTPKKSVYRIVFLALFVLGLVLVARFNYAQMHAPKHSFEMEVNATCTRYTGVLLDNPSEYPECHRASMFLKKSETWWCVEKLFYDYLGSYICAIIDRIHNSIVNYFYTSAGIEMAKAATPHAAVGIGKGFVDGIMKFFGFGAKAKLV